MGVEWVGATATRIAQAVQRGDATATQVIADHIDHGRLADRVLDTLRVFRDAEAIAEAEQVDEQPDLGCLPLAGVPVLVAEDTPVAGLPTWRGSAAARTGVAASDHEVVRRLRGTGAVVLGVTRLAELGLWGMTDDPAAITRNPWRSDRSSGGAAGGAAAAVAAGLAPIAQATDGFGSLRVPAACCGVVGLKPGLGLINYGLGEWFGIAEHGVIASTVEDAAAAFGALAGRTEVAPIAAGRLRIAMSTHSPLPGVVADGDARAAVSRAARALVGLGHDAVAADPPYPVRLPMLVTATWSAAAFRAADGLTDLQPRTRWQAALGGQALRRRLVRDGERLDWRERCRSWLAEGGFDALLLPTLPGPPPVAAYWSERSWRANVAATLRVAAFTAPWNLAGLPAMTVPTERRSDGMPGSVQLVGPPGSESVLLGLASDLQRALPWRRHAPTWPRDPSAHLRERTAAYPVVRSRAAAAGNSAGLTSRTASPPSAR